MTRLSMFSSPLFLGFDHFEQVLDRVAKSASDGYPPYNIEQMGEDSLRITLAVAGFAASDLAITVEDSQLIIRGRQEDAPGRSFVHRGIAARQFQRVFLLADGIEVQGARLDSGLLHIDLRRPPAAATVRTIAIETAAPAAPALDGEADGTLRVRKAGGRS